MNCKHCNKILIGGQKKYCSETCKKVWHINKNRKEFKEKTGHSLQSIKGIKVKLDIIKEMGGGCSICKYNKNLSALQFHHLDPKTKEFGIDLRIMSNSNIEKVRKELAKCILVCSNCHKEIHFPNLDIAGLDLKVNQHEEAH